jgi:hypothetical protein
LTGHPISLHDANAAIIEYRRATGDSTGTLDLMMTFVAVAASQTADCGVGDEAYFAAIERKVEAILVQLPSVRAGKRTEVIRRLRQACTEARDIGWGFGDYMRDVEFKLEGLSS